MELILFISILCIAVPVHIFREPIGQHLKELQPWINDTIEKHLKK